MGSELEGRQHAKAITMDPGRKFRYTFIVPYSRGKLQLHFGGSYREGKTKDSFHSEIERLFSKDEFVINFKPVKMAKSRS
eukprot:IDg17203t1